MPVFGKDFNSSNDFEIANNLVNQYRRWLSLIYGVGLVLELWLLVYTLYACLCKEICFIALAGKVAC